MDSKLRVAGTDYGEDPTVTSMPSGILHRREAATRAPSRFTRSLVKPSTRGVLASSSIALLKFLKADDGAGHAVSYLCRNRKATNSAVDFIMEGKRRASSFDRRLRQAIYLRGDSASRLPGKHMRLDSAFLPP